jgi:hypothetical protein
LIKTKNHKKTLTLANNNHAPVVLAVVAETDKQCRQAATLFLRPREIPSWLTVPPSDVFLDKFRKNCKLQDWLDRVDPQ